MLSIFITCGRSRWLTMRVLYGQKCGTTDLFLMILLVITLSFCWPPLVTTFNACKTTRGPTLKKFVLKTHLVCAHGAKVHPVKILQHGVFPHSRRFRRHSPTSRLPRVLLNLRSGKTLASESKMVEFSAKKIYTTPEGLEPSVSTISKPESSLPHIT